MSTKQINGIQLEEMLKNGLAMLQSREEEINRLNVFPVSDGDTGTNMRLTLENGIRAAKTDENAGAYLRALSKGMLLGARGNSGVILSQFFRGFYSALENTSQPDSAQIYSALESGCREAYHAVVTPAEGTILTVTREGVENIRSQANGADVEELLSLYIDEMKRSLERTPDLLPVLREAGVVDSGALGFIAIAEGMLCRLRGEVLTAAELSTPEKTVNFDLFNENSAFEDGYCMEFILQLMNAPRYDRDFDTESFIGSLKEMGSSIVAVRDGTRVKVHIHTMNPAEVMILSRKYGEFLTFKLENMQVQHNEHDRKLKIPGKPAHKSLAVVAVVNGDGMKRLFKELGCDEVIDGGATMNTSSQEFVEAFGRLNADAVAVLPNNPNVILAAEQAAKLSGAENIRVLPSKSVAEGYFAIAMDMSESDDVDFRLNEMRRGLENTVTLCEATASRDYADGEISCKAGDEILLADNKVVCAGSDPAQTVLDGFSAVEDIEDRDICVIFRGEGAGEDGQEALRLAVEERYPMLEVEFINGGQSVWHWIIGLA